MRTKPYSKDLREKVINYIQRGESQQSAARVFSLHYNTVNRWWKRYKKEGNFLARIRVGAKRRLNIEELSGFVEENPNCKLSDIAKQLKITVAWASIMLRKIGYSYKKNRLPIWKQVKTNG